MMEQQRNWYKQGTALLAELSNTFFPKGIASLWYLGQSGFALKSKELLVFFDPVFADLQKADGTTRRYYPAPFSPGDAAQTGVSYVFCSHDHLDHLQPGTIAPIAKTQPKVKIVVPAPSVEKALSIGIPEGQIIAACAEQTIGLPDGCVCTPIPAAHEEYETDEKGNQKSLSYIFRTSDGMKIFHAGDTVVTPELTERLQQEKGFTAALLPINGADYKRRRRGVIGNMNSREAADLSADINADLVIPCHYDMVFGNGENPLHFAEYMQTYYPGRKFHMLSLGERILLTANQ
jgi:L-ascorbate metabolism protein UlaG (beta-lactamase superfamily)